MICGGLCIPCSSDVQHGSWWVTGEKVYLYDMWSQVLVTNAKGQIVTLKWILSTTVSTIPCLTKSWGCVPFKQTLIHLMLHHTVWGSQSHRQSYWSSEAALNSGSAEWPQGGCLEPKCLNFPPGPFHSHWDAPPHLPPPLPPPLGPLYPRCHSLVRHRWGSLWSLGWWRLCIERPWCNCDHQHNPK